MGRAFVHVSAGIQGSQKRYQGKLELQVVVRAGSRTQITKSCLYSEMSEPSLAPRWGNFDG